MIGDLTLYCAKVIDIDDTDKQGKIQINIESRFKDFKKNDYPWAIPLLSDVSESTMSFNPPKVNSQVWVLVDKYWKRFYYLTNRYFYNLFDFSKVSGLLDKCDKINKDYKNIRFNYYEDGTLLFHNNNDGSSGIVTSQGTVIYIDKDGDLVRNVEKDEITEIKGDRKETIKGKSEVSIQGDYNLNVKGKEVRSITSNLDYQTKGSITLKSTTPSLVEIGNTVATLGSILNELCQDLAKLATVGSPGSHTSPTLTAQMLTLIPKIKMVFK